MRFLLASVVATFGLLLLTACSSTTTATSSRAPQAGAAASAPAQMVSVRATDSLRFEPSSLTVNAGQPVQVTLTNAGQMQHDWSLTQGATQPVKIVANAGQTAVGTFTIQQPGTYTFICSVPGHAAAGMQGTITAQ
jgi:nitrite reductase (NO-forming)